MGYHRSCGKNPILRSEQQSGCRQADYIYESNGQRGACRRKKIVDYKNAADGIEMIFNSSKEWRGGCSLAKNDKLNNNAAPVYAAQNSSWDWQHLLLEQQIHDSGNANKLLTINKYDKLLFKVTLDLKNSQRMSSPYYTNNGSCPEWRNHAILYIAFVLDDATHPGDATRRIYAIFPAWYTYDGLTYYKGGPWLGGDPISTKVYFTGMVGSGAKYEPLTAGQERTYSIDVQEMAAEAIGGYNQKHADGSRSWSAANYVLSDILIGWEIWGGYNTDVIIKNPTLTGYTYSSTICPLLHHYQFGGSPTDDQYYSTDYIPQGFGGYDYVGAAARIPEIAMPGTVALWRYWNPSLGDHYYSTNLRPFGLGNGWVFERQAGSIFINNPGAGYEPFQEWWCRSHAHHLYQLVSAGTPYGCFLGPNTIGWLAKP